MEATIATDFNSVQEDDITMTKANEAIENIISPDDTMSEWKENNCNANREKKKDKPRELLEKK